MNDAHPQINAFTLEDVANGVCGLCAYFHPIKSTIEIQIYGSRIGVGIV